MKERSTSYLRTFQNTPEGNADYKFFLYEFRRVVKGGRICKFFRGGTRNYHRFISKMTGKQVTMGGSCSLNDGTHFDVYLLGGSWKDGKRTAPKVFNMVLGSN